MGPTALLPLRRKACWGFFFAPKIRRLRLGANPRTWVPKDSTLPLDHRSRLKADVNSSCNKYSRWQKVNVQSAVNFRSFVNKLSGTVQNFVPCGQVCGQNVSSVCLQGTARCRCRIEFCGKWRRVHWQIADCCCFFQTNRIRFPDSHMKTEAGNVAEPVVHIPIYTTS
jgi:hypothetical protein